MHNLEWYTPRPKVLIKPQNAVTFFLDHLQRFLIALLCHFGLLSINVQKCHLNI